MQIEGKIVNFLPPTSGTGANGEWQKQQFIIETKEQYPKKICVTAWNKLLDALNHIQIGTTVTCHINVESKEHNGNWYTDVKVWKIESEGGKQQPQHPNESDDLPF